MKNPVFTVGTMFDFGYGDYLSSDETDYIGRQVIIYNDCYTVVKAEKKFPYIHCDINGNPYKNDAKLYLVCNYDNSDDHCGPKTQNIMASNIARPNCTIVHWASNVAYYRKNIDECHALYELGKMADRKRRRKYRINEFFCRQQQERRKAFFQQYKPEWAQAAIIATYQEDDCDIMTDYFHAVDKKRVLLGFSKHTRNNARELSKFAKLFEPTQNLAESYKVEKYYGYRIQAEDMGIWGSGWYVKKTERFDDRIDFEHYLYNILPNMK